MSEIESKIGMYGEGARAHYVAPDVIAAHRRMGNYGTNDAAMCMVSERHAKGDLVQMTAYLLTRIAELEQQLAAARKNEARWLWLWNHAHNVSFTYQENSYTRTSVMGLHCGTLAEILDSLIAKQEGQRAE